MTEVIRADFPEARILVVDDEEQSVRLLERILARGGYTEVQGVSDSSRVVEAFRSASPDLVVLDIHMPFPDGFALLEHMRLSLPKGAYLPVLVLTGQGDMETRYRALAIGATDFLTKPFQVLEVLYRIRNLLHARSLYLELERAKDALTTLRPPGVET